MMKEITDIELGVTSFFLFFCKVPLQSHHNLKLFSLICCVCMRVCMCACMYVCMWIYIIIYCLRDKKQGHHKGIHQTLQHISFFFSKQRRRTGQPPLFSSIQPSNWEQPGFVLSSIGRSKLSLRPILTIMLKQFGKQFFFQ